MFQRAKVNRSAVFTLRPGQILLIGNACRLFFEWDKTLDQIQFRSKESGIPQQVKEKELIQLESDLSVSVEFSHGNGNRLRVAVMETVRYPVSVISPDQMDVLEVGVTSHETSVENNTLKLLDCRNHRPSIAGNETP